MIISLGFVGGICKDIYFRGLAKQFCGQFAESEMHTFSGPIDCKVETDKSIYLIEFKRDKTAEEALSHIDIVSYRAYHIHCDISPRKECHFHL